jgi:hypothetical protein
VAARSKAWAFRRVLAGIVGSNPSGGMDVCLLWVFVLSGTGLCDGPIPRPEESCRVWWVCMWSRNLQKEAAYARFGLLRHRKGKRLTEKRVSLLLSMKRCNSIFTFFLNLSLEISTGLVLVKVNNCSTSHRTVGICNTEKCLLMPVVPLSHQIWISWCWRRGYVLCIRRKADTWVCSTKHHSW